MWSVPKTNFEKAKHYNLNFPIEVMPRHAFRRRLVRAPAFKRRRISRRQLNHPRFDTRYAPNISVSRSIGCPDKQMVVLPWFHQAAPAAAMQYLHVYRANSCFDPDFTGVGSQPNYFDEWSALYNQYRVHFVKVEMNLASATIGAHWAAGFTDVDPTGQSFVDSCARKYGKFIGSSGNMSGGSDGLRHTATMSIKKLNGLRWIENEENLAAVSNANPADVSWFYIHGLSQDNGGSNVSFILNSLFTFYVEFFDPVNVDQS